MTSSVWDFLIIFFTLFCVLVIVVVTLVFRGKPNQKEDSHAIDNKDKVIVKEIVKVRCRYCGFTYDQGLDSCPNCGART